MLNLFLMIPLNLFPCRLHLLVLLGRDKEEDFDKSLHMMLTAVLILLSAFVAIVYPDIVGVLALFGGTCGSMISIYIPGTNF